MKRNVRLVFADGHESTVALDLGDPFARMEIVPLVDKHGQVVSSTLGPRSDDMDEEDRNLGRPRNRLERSVA